MKMENNYEILIDKYFLCDFSAYLNTRSFDLPIPMIEQYKPIGISWLQLLRVIYQPQALLFATS